jgi:hypothetical protein
MTTGSVLNKRENLLRRHAQLLSLELIEADERGFSCQRSRPEMGKPHWQDLQPGQGHEEREARAMSSSQNVGRRSASQAISGWLPALARPPGLAFWSTATCCVTGAASSLLPMGRTLGPSKRISGIGRSNRLCATPPWRLTGSRTSGRTDAALRTNCRRYLEVGQGD